MSVSGWTEERVATLLEMQAAGASARMIAAELGITRNAVIGKAGRMGVMLTSPPGRRTDAAPKRPRRHPPRPKRLRVWDEISSGHEVCELPPDQSACAVTLLEAKPEHCRWPIERAGQPMMFCGDTVVREHSWCPRHFRIAFKERAA